MNRHIGLLAVLGVGLCAAPEPGLRLPAGVRPLSQKVEATLVPGRDAFHGRTEIEVQLQDAQKTVWLNAEGLKILSATVNGAPARVRNGNQSVALEVDNPVGPGAARLALEYDGTISRQSSAGVFQLQEDGNWYVYTQFEPTDARRAFPCFDDPQYKIPWEITLRVPAGDMAVANTPEVSSVPAQDGMKLVKFARTRPLPSYLVAFATGPFEAVDAGRSKRKRVPLRIIVPKGHAEGAAFARQAIPALLELLEDYFDSPYPYEKLDSIAMPISNFAMENVGLITYGQSLLLESPDRDTTERRRGCATVVAHEMAHQWFGDLVTTAWWDDIWLNEAFATWMEQRIVSQWKPDWGGGVDRVESQIVAMDADSLATARRIRQPIESMGDIANAFDAITYQKGAAVIGMFEHYIGSDKFRRGVQLYLKRHADRNATARDFLAALSEKAGQDIAPAFSTFLDQPGIPAVTAELRCDGGKGRLELSQKRWLPAGSAGGQGQEWRVPVCVRDGGDSGQGGSACTLLASKTGETTAPGRRCPAWVEGNAGQVGYYRTIYKGDLLSRVLAHSSALTDPEKVGLLSDIRAELRSGDVTVAEALDIVRKFANDPSTDVVANLVPLAGIVPEDEVPAALLPGRAAFIRSVFGRKAEELGWSGKPGESPGAETEREAIVPFVATQGRDERLIAEAKKLARTWLDTRKGVDPAMLGAVLDTAAEFGDRALFDQLLVAAKSEKDAGVRETLIRALGSFRDPDLSMAAMRLLLDGPFDIREAASLYTTPLEFPETHELPFRFAKEHADELSKKVPREVGGDYAASFVVAANAFCSAAGAREGEAFFGPRAKEWTGAERRLANSLEIIRLCEARRNLLVPQLQAVWGVSSH